VTRAFFDGAAVAFLSWAILSWSVYEVYSVLWQRRYALARYRNPACFFLSIATTVSS
jgi:hypothetical protein